MLNMKCIFGNLIECEAGIEWKLLACFDTSSFGLDFLDCTREIDVFSSVDIYIWQSRCILCKLLNLELRQSFFGIIMCTLPLFILVYKCV